MKTGGINLRVGTFPGGLWYDSRPTANIKPGWGINLAVLWGPVVWNIPKFWDKRSWDQKYDGHIWKVVKFPFIVAPFLSVSLGKIGFYIGFKQNGWAENSCLHPSMRSTSSRDI